MTGSGARKWVVNLHKYMILHGLKFSKSDHVFFIHVLYGLLTTKHVDTVTLDTFAKVSPAFGRVWKACTYHRPQGFGSVVI